jgi:hypothetical protein
MNRIGTQIRRTLNPGRFERGELAVARKERDGENGGDHAAKGA